MKIHEENMVIVVPSKDIGNVAEVSLYEFTLQVET